ncbi:bestrophin family protein [Tellurirhabdus rosea]|uniref:bestrophin family protein n=1 Tax=Tellurirhabdus rosea TaxID=2674997 RepID=UPI00224F5D86|nr:bestrophin family ion channel [Tellurirhabdus rosea]
MIKHDTKEWLSHIFNLRRSDTLRTLLPVMLGLGAYAALVVYLIREVFQLPDDSPLRNVSLIHTLLGFVISLLLVFRTNTAYDRWWEGRKLWGSLVNNSRNLALKLNGLLAPDQAEDREFFAAMIANFAFALKNHLRNHSGSSTFQESALFKAADLRPDHHLPGQISAALFGRVSELQRRGVLLPEHTLLLKDELQSFMDICGACERIHNTPIPFSYSSFIKKFIFTYCVTLPLGYAFSLEYHVVTLAVFVFYVLGSLEIIAEEIEDPFGTDANDLPTETICRNISRSVGQLLLSAEAGLPAPSSAKLNK